MPSNHKGHFVQIWRPTHGPDVWPKRVNVEGRVVATSIARDSYIAKAAEGWSFVSRELPLRRAKFFAKAYSRAGFPARIVKVDGNGERIVYSKNPARKAVRE